MAVFHLIFFQGTCHRSCIESRNLNSYIDGFNCNRGRRQCSQNVVLMTAAQIPEPMKWAPEEAGILPLSVHSKEMLTRIGTNGVLRCLTSSLSRLSRGIDVQISNDEVIRVFGIPYCFVGDYPARLDAGKSIVIT